MIKNLRAVWVAALFGALLPQQLHASASALSPNQCSADLASRIPARKSEAPAGSDFVNEIMKLRGPARDAAVAEEVASGNVPDFLRHLTPVKLSGKTASGEDLDIVICVTPDYLAVGRDSDYVRVPMGLPTAAALAESFGFILPTTAMVDAIYQQAVVHLAPAPMTPGAQMESTDYFWRHNQTVEAQRAKTGKDRAALTAGQKKDIVLTTRLRSKLGRVAIYGWHRPGGKPIQPLSTVHGESYADYSHGVRLVSGTAFVNGEERPLTQLLQDPQIAGVLSREGPISQPERLLASLR
ncbi:hypothetical protein [Actibacterium sp. MT2.3-13A]|uniref:hypothetical protein n=1 Tax=Actibacterium sp. MT2.3-13A TaxID=2828332 RepID=UPI001BA89BC9|nr:hypothetical protein [Actibacterium sp. MT2.3-13A]